MPTTEDKLESLFATVRTLPKERKELAVEALSEIAEEELYIQRPKISTCSLGLARSGGWWRDTSGAELRRKYPRDRDRNMIELSGWYLNLS